MLKLRDCNAPGTVLNNKTYKPISEQEHIWPGICTREEIAIKFDEVRGTSGSKIKVPSCFVAATNKTGHIDFMNSLQSDGTPYGGSMDSQAPDISGYGALDSNSMYDR